MTNTPLDFLTNHLNVRLDLLYISAGSAAALGHPGPRRGVLRGRGRPIRRKLERLRRLFARWPRPAPEQPACLPTLERDILCRLAGGLSRIVQPARRRSGSHRIGRAHPVLAHRSPALTAPHEPYPCLIRPLASHAGAGLARIENAAELERYLRLSFDRRFFLTSVRGLRQSRRPVSQIPRGLHRPRAVPVPHGDFQPLDGPLPERRDDRIRREAGRGGPCHGRIRRRFRPPPRRRVRCPARTDGPRLLLDRLR